MIDVVCECGHTKEAHRDSMCWALHCACVRFMPRLTDPPDLKSVNVADVRGVQQVQWMADVATVIAAIAELDSVPDGGLVNGLECAFRSSHGCRFVPFEGRDHDPGCPVSIARKLSKGKVV